VGALEIVWQTDVHVEHGDGVLDADRFILNLDRVANRLDANLVDRNIGAYQRCFERRECWV
jgi:hypothetical protein